MLWYVPQAKIFHMTICLSVCLCVCILAPRLSLHSLLQCMNNCHFISTVTVSFSDLLTHVVRNMVMEVGGRKSAHCYLLEREEVRGTL